MHSRELLLLVQEGSTLPSLSFLTMAEVVGSGSTSWLTINCPKRRYG